MRSDPWLEFGACAPTPGWNSERALRPLAGIQSESDPIWSQLPNVV